MLPTYNLKQQYIIVQQSRQTISEKTQTINLVFFQICFSSHKLFPFILQFPFQSIRIERMDIYTNFYAIWRSVSLEIEKITQLLILTVLVLSFLKH